MIVSMWMTKNPYTVAPDAAVAVAHALLESKRVRRLPVVDRQVGLVGVLSTTDIARAFPSQGRKNGAADPCSGRDPAQVAVAEIMHANPVTTTPDAPIEQAARAMRDNKIGTLPVLRNNVLIGLITESDIFRAFVSIFAAEDDEVRITFDISSGEDTFAMVAREAAEHGVRVKSLMTSVQSDAQVCVVRLAGAHVDRVLDQLWSSGHRVVNVLRGTSGHPVAPPAH